MAPVDDLRQIATEVAYREQKLTQLLNRSMVLSQHKIDFSKAGEDVAEWAWIEHEYTQLTGLELPVCQY